METMLVAVCLSLALQDPVVDARLVLPEASFEVVATIPVPENPHGTCFSMDGRLAYVACAGGDRIVVLDTEKLEVVRELPAGRTPLDVMLDPAGMRLIATQFQGDGLLSVALAGDGAPIARRLRPGPSLFSPPDAQGRRYVACEMASFVYEVDSAGAALRSWPTAARPYPADVTDDGILLFVPCRDASTVVVIDTLNDRRITEVPIGKGPQGGALTNDDVSYVAACGAEDRIVYVNTASFEVTASVEKGVGPRPFAVTMTLDGRFSLINNAGGRTVSVLDVPARRIVGELVVGPIPIVVRAHPDGRHLYVASEGDHTVSVIRYEPSPTPATSDLATEVLVLGMIHSGHRTSTSYGLEVVRDLVRAVEPDFICTEIPPNRFEQAMGEFRATGKISEQRVRVFPEYTDVVFGLTREMNFEIIPTAGWTSEMNDYRRARLAAIKSDPERAEQWAEHEATMKAMDESIEAMGADDDPRKIHTDAYDALIDRGFGPYNRHFNDDLADGGWENINAKHYALIAAHLDAIRGQGKRVLVTFGSAHKGWFLRELRRRDDVTLLEVSTFLDQLGLRE